MKRLSLVLLFLLQVVGICLGQVFSNVTSECYYGKNKTYEEALEDATERAKAKAIEVTCGTDVSKFSILRTTNDRENYTSKTITNSYAVVRVFDRRVEKKRNRVIVSIDGEVCTSSVPISMYVGDVRRMYTNDDRITFNVSFYKDSYIKIFWFDEETGDGGLLYPQPGSYVRKFEGDNSTIRFPFVNETSYFSVMCPQAKTYEETYNEWAMNGRVSAPPRREADMPQPRNAGGGKWHLVGSGTNKKIEKHVSIVFVTTEHNIPCNLSYINEENFLEWWCALPYSERALPVKKHITLKM